MLCLKKKKKEIGYEKARQRSERRRSKAGLWNKKGRELKARHRNDSERKKKLQQKEEEYNDAHEGEE